MKLNPEYIVFDGNMFERLLGLLEDVRLPSNLPVIDMSIGEPKQPPAKILRDSVIRNNDNWQYYPKAAGNSRFVSTIHEYIARRWPEAAGIVCSDHIIPVPGTREPLHLLGNLVRGSKSNPLALITNPFYHAWRAGGVASGARIKFLNCTVENNFLPELDSLKSNDLENATVLYLCNPTNPQGSVMELGYLKKILRLARENDFLLIMDECYSDIWRGSPPIGALQAVASLEKESKNTVSLDLLSNLVVLNSLSKRSGAAGLRAGFMVGDKTVIKQYSKLVANGGSLVPTPLLEVAADLYSDDSHVEAIRSYYDNNFRLVEQHLGIGPPPGGFFLWLKVDDDLTFTRRLMAEQGVRVLPGSFMGVEAEGTNPGSGYVRLALVNDSSTTNEGLLRVAKVYKSQ